MRLQALDRPYCGHPPEVCPKTPRESTLALTISSLQWNVLYHLHRTLTTYRNNGITKSIGRESGFAVHEIVLPLPSKHLDIGFGHIVMLLEQRWFDRLFKISTEIFSPQSKRFRIVRPNVFNIVNNQSSIGSFTYRPYKLRHSWEVATRKDVPPDEIVTFGVGFISLVGFDQ